MVLQEYHPNSDAAFTKKSDSVDHREMIYGESKKELEEHYHYLRQEINKAELGNDLGRKADLKKQLEKFIQHISSCFGKNGTSRQFRNDFVKNKDRIYKSIIRALNAIRKHDEKTWRHFYNALKPINSSFHSYCPDREISWITE